MQADELKQIIEQNNLKDELSQKSMEMDESDQHSRELWLTIWNDGKATLSLTQRGNDYPPETYKSIKDVVVLPRICIYDNYDIQAAYDNGITDDDIQDDAISCFKENFDIDTYIKEAVEQL